MNISRMALHNALYYNPITGLFWHKQRKQGIRVGKPAGCRAPTGYWLVQVNGKQYYAHRLAWFYVHGVWPHTLDHKDRNRSNNAIENLRLATHSQNRFNRCPSEEAKKSKLPRGVYLCTHDNSKFRAQLYVNKKCVYLGLFKNIKDAELAYKNAANVYFKEFVPKM